MVANIIEAEGKEMFQEQNEGTGGSKQEAQNMSGSANIANSVVRQLKSVGQQIQDKIDVGQLDKLFGEEYLRDEKKQLQQILDNIDSQRGSFDQFKIS